MDLSMMTIKTLMVPLNGDQVEFEVPDGWYVESVSDYNDKFLQVRLATTWVKEVGEDA